jgi:peptidylprolyl isomerase
LLPALAACGGGDDDKSASAAQTTGASLKQVSFSGDVGKAINATWKSSVAKPSSTSVTTLVKGSGETIASGDQVSTYLWIADGTTKKQAFSDYDNGQAETLPNNGQLGTVFDKLFAGQTYGSRVVAVTNATDLLGSADAATQIGVGKNDSLVVVADLVKKVTPSPTPTDDKAHDVSASMMPKVITKDGKPTGFDWTGVSKPALTTPVQRVILSKGSGRKVKSTDTVTVKYLGETYGAKTPFDENYSKKALSMPLSSVVKGWPIGLTGVTVGSRVLIQMPPAYGYDAEGKGSIKGNETLWFVIDVLKAK